MRGFGFAVFLPRLNKFLNYLSEAGYRVSRTHFDPMGVRTNAPLAQFKTVLMEYSTPTYVGAQAEGPVHLPADIQVGEEVPAAAAIKVEEAELAEDDKCEVSAATQPYPTHCAAD